MGQTVRALVGGDLDHTQFASLGVDQSSTAEDFAMLQMALDLDQPDLVIVRSELPGFDSAHRVSDLRMTSPRTYVIVVTDLESEASAAAHGGAHLTCSNDDLSTAVSSAVDQIRRDLHRRVRDRRTRYDDLPPGDVSDRRGINWGRTQGMFNEGQVPE